MREYRHYTRSRTFRRHHESVRREPNDYFMYLCEQVDKALEAEGFKADITVFDTGTAEVHLTGNEDFDFESGYAEISHNCDAHPDGDYITVKGVHKIESYDISCNDHLVDDIVNGVLEVGFD